MKFNKKDISNLKFGDGFISIRTEPDIYYKDLNQLSWIVFWFGSLGRSDKINKLREKRLYYKGRL